MYSKSGNINLYDYHHDKNLAISNNTSIKALPTSKKIKTVFYKSFSYLFLDILRLACK